MHAQPDLLFPRTNRSLGHTYFFSSINVRFFHQTRAREKCRRLRLMLHMHTRWNKFLMQPKGLDSLDVWVCVYENDLVGFEAREPTKKKRKRTRDLEWPEPVMGRALRHLSLFRTSPQKSSGQCMGILGHEQWDLRVCTQCFWFDSSWSKTLSSAVGSFIR